METIDASDTRPGVAANNPSEQSQVAPVVTSNITSEQAQVAPVVTTNITGEQLPESQGEAAVKTDEQILKEQVEPIIKTYVDLQLELNTLRSASASKSDADWTAFGKKVDTASSALKTVATAVEQYKSTPPTNADQPQTAEEIAIKITALREEIANLENEKKPVPVELRENLSNLKVMSQEIAKKAIKETPLSGAQIQRDQEQLAREAAQQNDKPRIMNEDAEFAKRDASAAAAAAANLEQANRDKKQNGGGSSSSSKKNRKSHKSYHPGIGKTRKHHHSHSEPKRVSFVHQA
jgi:hypothetical protein